MPVKTGRSVPSASCPIPIKASGQTLAVRKATKAASVGADEVLLACGVDCDLAADRAVDLRERGGGDVDHGTTALEQ